MTKRDKRIEKLFSHSKISLKESRFILIFCGYHLVRTKGSHEQWIKEGQTFTLPCHGKSVPHTIIDLLRKMVGKSDEKKNTKVRLPN
jgi:predicted RNA binding protein YcfA (HicA-like mRNA interferase family)